MPSRITEFPSLRAHTREQALAIALLCILALGWLLPPALGQIPPSFTAKGTARSIDLSVPGANALPGADQFKGGLSVGATAAGFTSAPSVEGFAGAFCHFLSSESNPAEQCEPFGSYASSSTVEGRTSQEAPRCEAPASSFLKAKLACGTSRSQVGAENWNGTNDAAGGEIYVDLNLTDFPEDFEGGKNEIFGAVSGVVTNITNNVPNDKFKAGVADFLDRFGEGKGKVAAIKVGASTTNISTEGVVITMKAIAAGGTIGLLGIDNALIDGLIIIEVTAGSATVSWDRATGIATATSTPALARVSIKDYGDFCSSAADAPEPLPEFCERPGYVGGGLTPLDLSPILAPLNNVDFLATEITAADHAPQSPQSGPSASAHTTGVSIHALKGMGQTSGPGLSGGSRDGGILLRVAAANVELASVRGAPVLPVTGGDTGRFHLATTALILASALMISIATILRSRTRKARGSSVP